MYNINIIFKKVASGSLEQVQTQEFIRIHSMMKGSEFPS